MAKVTALPKPANDAPAAAEEMVPPFEIAVAANFADHQQCHIRMPVKDPITRAEANRLTDLAVNLAQRQVSRMEIGLNEAALKDKRKALDLQHRRRAEEAEKHAKAIADVEEDIVRIAEKQAALEQQVATTWRARNRQGDPKLEGKDKNTHAALARDIEKQRDKVKTLEAEYLQKVAKAQDDIIERLTEEIAAIERVIEKHQEIVG